MVGTIALAGISVLALGFLGVFFAVLCKERRHIRVCMLLGGKAEANAGSRSADEYVPRPDTPFSNPVKLIVPSRCAQARVVPIRQPEQWRKTG